MFKIDTKVPPPTEYLPKPKEPKYPFRELKKPYKNGSGLVFESFRVPTTNGNARKMLARLGVAASTYGKKLKAKFIVRSERGGARCWRVN